MNAPRIVLLDEVHARIEGLDPPRLRTLIRRWSFFDPAARFSPLYVMGAWDGRVRFVRADGGTFVSLVGELLRDLRAQGFTPVVEDRRRRWRFDFPTPDADWFARRGCRWPAGTPAAGEPIRLRPHQVAAVERLLSVERGILEMATGGGKTLVLATLADVARAHGRVWIVVPSGDLLTQTARTLEAVGVEHGRLGDGHDERDQRVVVATWAKLHHDDRRRRLEVPDDLAAVIVDEVHTARAAVLRRLLTRRLAAVPLRWGLTGTVPRAAHERWTVITALGPILGQLGPKRLQDLGVLAESDLVVVRLRGRRYPRDWEGQRRQVATGDVELDAFAAAIKARRHAGPVLAFGTLLETVRGVAERVPGARVLAGDMPTRQRAEVLEAIRGGDADVVVATYGVASTGLDIPSLTTVVLWDLGRSPIRVLQSIGRGLRRTTTKDRVLLLDLVPDASYYMRHLRERLRLYREVGFPVRRMDLPIDGEWPADPRTEAEPCES